MDRQSTTTRRNSLSQPNCVGTSTTNRSLKIAPYNPTIHLSTSLTFIHNWNKSVNPLPTTCTTQTIIPTDTFYTLVLGHLPIPGSFTAPQNHVHFIAHLSFRKNLIPDIYRKLPHELDIERGARSSAFL